MYKVCGNTKVLLDNLNVMEKWCVYILNRCKLLSEKGGIPEKYDRYLWNRGYHQGDWLVPSLSKETSDDFTETLKIQKITAEYAAPMFGYNTFRIMAEVTDILGLKEKSGYYHEIVDKMKEAIGEALFDKEGDLPSDLMGAYVLAVAFDLIPKKYEAHVKEKLVRLLEKNGGCLDTGFLSTPYLLDAYCKIGRKDLAFDLLFQSKSPSWLYEVEKGATAIWESWESFEADGNPKHISFNHYAYGCVDKWIFENICGIKPLEAGFKKILIQPVIDQRIDFAEREFYSVYGEIKVKWSKNNSRFILNCSIPCNTSAKVVLPSGKSFDIGSGIYDFEEELSI